MKTKYGILWLLCTVLWLGACQNEGISYYPIGKKHLGETYTEYVMNNVVTTDTGYTKPASVSAPACKH